MSEAEAEAILLDRYGLRAKAEPLRSERDQNFLMTDSGGTRMVLKLSNGVQDQRLSQFQTSALRHVAYVDPTLPVPRVVETRDGRSQFTWTDADGAVRIGHLVSFVSGVPLADQPRRSVLASHAGTVAARLGRALRGFFDPAAGHALLWDFKHVASLRGLLPAIPRERDRALSTAAIDRFGDHVAPRLPALRGQIIHNDLNPHNMLVDPACPDHLVGVIDFGDLVFGALIGDVAVATSYLLTQDADPFAMVTAFVGAYNAVTPLEEEELALLPDLIATRHAMTCTITAWRAQLYPDNAAYILRNVEAAAIGLAALDGGGRAVLARRLADVCRGEKRR